MSSLLREAIVDAKALRESALKNAETSIIEKYSEEVKQTLEQLLEQDELGAEPAPADIAKNIPLAATDDLSEEEGDIPEGMDNEGDEVPVSIDLDALQEAVKALESELEEGEEETIEITEEDLAEILSPSIEEIAEECGDVPHGAPVDDDDEEVEIGLGESVDETETVEEDKEQNESAGLDADALVDAIMEKLTVDMGADLSGWAGRSSDSMKLEIEKELAHRRSTDVDEELETLKKAQEELVFENKQLDEQLNKHKQVVKELKEGLQNVNLSNARLLYTNRVLRNTSLNERQKTKIVEAISNAGSVAEAKVISEALQSTVGESRKRRPQSLSEAISNKRSSVIRASRHESTSSDPISDRMKKLAGIK